MSAAPESITFLDDRTFAVGARVRFSTKHGSEGTGTITGFGRNLGTTTIKVAADDDIEWGHYDRWPIKAGGFYDRLATHGIHGGEIVEILGS